MAPPATPAPGADPDAYKVSPEDVVASKLAQSSLTSDSSKTSSRMTGGMDDENELFHRKHGYISDMSSKYANEIYDPDNFDPKQYHQPPPWYQQFGVRAFFVATALCFLLTFIVMRGALMVGQSPPLSVPAGILTFLLIQAWCGAAKKLGFKVAPFTAQENTTIQTCVVAGASLAWGAGFPSAFLGMAEVAYETLGPSSGNRLQDTIPMDVKHTLPFTPLVAFSGVTMLISLRKLFIIDFDLPWPGGTVIGLLMNSFHGAHNSTKAWRQCKVMAEWFTATFTWAIFRWCWSGYDGKCGFEKMPFFGLKAYRYGWYWKLQTMYIGAGMIVPAMVSFSMMVGGIFSWGILWPWLMTKAGLWYPLKTVGTDQFTGLYGYKTCLAMALLLGDAIYNMGKVIYMSYRKYKLVKLHKASGINREYDPRNAEDDAYSLMPIQETPVERRVRLYYFYKDNIPWYFGVGAFLFVATIGVIALPFLFPGVKFYHVILVNVLLVPLTLANAYAGGLTDFNLGVSYSKVCIFVFAAILGKEKGGLIVGLVLSLIVKCCSNQAVEMLEDFQTGYLTLTSSKAMLYAQLYGAAIGCVMTPVCFYLFWNAFPIGVSGGEWPAPYAALYRGIAVLGLEGFSMLPLYCMWMSFGFFMLGLLLDVIRDVLPIRYGYYVPFPVAMALPMFIGVYLPIEYCIGAVARRLWRMKDANSEKMFMPAVATGLIIGDGIWSLPAAIMSMVGVEPPLCIMFRNGNEKNTAFPNGLY